MPSRTTVYTKEDVFTLQVGVMLHTNSDFKFRYPKRYFQYDGVKYELNKGIIIDILLAGESFVAWNVTKLSDGSNQVIYTTDLIDTLELINLPVFSNSSLNSSINYNFVYNGKTFSVVNGRINSVQNSNPAKVWIGIDNFNQPTVFYSSNSLYELAIGARLYTDKNLSYFDRSKRFIYQSFEYNFENGSNMIANAPSQIVYKINQNLTNSNSRLNPSLPDVFYTHRYGTNTNLYSDRQLTTLLFNNLNQNQINQIKTNNSSLFNQQGQMNLYSNWGNNTVITKVDLSNSTYQPSYWNSYNVEGNYTYASDERSPNQILVDNIEKGVLYQAEFLKTLLDGPNRKLWEETLTRKGQFAEEDILRNIYNSILRYQDEGREDLIPPFFEIKYDSTNGLAVDGKVVLSMGGFDVTFDKMYGTVLAEGLVGFGGVGAPIPQPLLGPNMVSSPDGSNAMPLSQYMDQFLETDSSSKDTITKPAGNVEIVGRSSTTLNDSANLFQGSDGNLYTDSSMTTKFDGFFAFPEPGNSGLPGDSTTTIGQSSKSNPAFNLNGTVNTVHYIVIPGGGMGGKFYSKQRGMYI